MEIFLDSADLNEITELSNAGIIDGVTTNPSLIKSAFEKIKKRDVKVNFEIYIKQILETLGGGKSVSLEVVSSDFEGMMKEAVTLYKKFNKVAKNVAIKIPINPSPSREVSFEGLRVIRALSENSIPVNCTLVMTPEQSLLAAKAGAVMISPFAGRVDDLIREKNKIKFKKEEYFPTEGIKRGRKILDDNGINSGVNLVSLCVQLKKNYGFKAKILAASVRNARQVREMALIGADILTLPYNVIKDLLFHEKTFEGMIKFNQDVVQEYSDLMK